MHTQVCERPAIAQEGHFPNNAYNLMSQLVEEHRSLWRIKNTYIQDASNCGECVTFWKDLATAKEDHIRSLQRLLDSRINC